MKIAVITGASAGLGREYAISIDKFRQDIEEIWLIARREEQLIKTGTFLKKPFRIIPLDITDDTCIQKYVSLLDVLGADVKILVNNAGFGKIGNFNDISTKDNAGMVRLNCEALTVMSSVTIPFMKNGGEIINSCSIASFAPNTRMAVYSSTKAYVMSLSRAMRQELKPLGINVIAVCPGPMDTEFLSIAGIEKGTSHTFDTLPRVNAKIMAEKSLNASNKKKAVYTNRVFYKFYRFLAKILPTSLVMKLAGT